MQAALPMWRNGRRNGLKIRFYESGVWVRVPPSAPSENYVYIGESELIPRDFVVADKGAWKRKITH